MLTKTKSIRRRRDFTEGPLFWRLILFALPVMATGLLQMLYNATDKMVVGQFSGDPTALGAIGSTTYISGLIINFMAGLGAGAGVVVAQLYGAKRESDTSKAVHTALLLALMCAALFSVVAYVTAEPLLRLLGTRETFMKNALLYIRIIYSGIFATAIYNFTASIFRATGDSKTPLAIGTVAGLMNVGLNFFFVLVFKMSVAGVAIATVISQYFSAVAGIVILMHRHGECYQFSFSKLRVDIALIRRIIRIGVPTGLQSTCFSITNMITASAINTFPDAYVTAHSVAGNIDGMLDVCSGAFLQSSMNATGQNFGAMKPKRILKVFGYSVLQASAIIFTFAWTLRFFRGELAALFVDALDPEFDDIIAATVEWTGIMLATYFMQGVMNAVLGTARGLGYSLAPLILNVLGTCVTRIMWVYFIFPLEPFNSFAGLAMVYPVSWTAASLLLSTITIAAFKKINRLKKQISESATKEAEPVNS